MASLADPTPVPAYSYLLHGKEEFFRSEQVAALREKMRALAGGEYNLTSLDGKNCTADEVIAACQVVPFLADRRMVIVSGLLGRLSGSAAERGPGRARRPSRRPSEELERFLDGLDHLPLTTSLVLVEERLEEWLVARFRGSRMVVRRFDAPRGERLVRWLQQRARRWQAELDQEAARALAAENDNLRRLDNEVAKLALFCEGRIDLQAVRSLVATEAGVFALLDAVAEGRSAEALTALRSLYQQGQPPEFVVGQLASLARRLLIVKELLAQGPASAPLAVQAAEHGLNPNTLPRLERQARALSAEQLERAVERLLEADRASKSGRMDPEVALELAVVELVRVPRPGRARSTSG